MIMTRILPLSLIVTQLAAFLSVCHGQGIALTSAELKAGLDNGDFDALVDVRTQDEWDLGHIEGATLVRNLATDGVEPTPILGCQNCTLAIYCRRGVRAGNAITRLVNEYGFNESRLYNGLGINQWTEEGFTLVTAIASIPAPCNDATYTCKEDCDNGCNNGSDTGNGEGDGDDEENVLTPEELKAGLDNGDFDALIDIRTQEEWDEGHIDGATFVMNLATDGVEPTLILGCQNCTLAIYCRRGNRARVAIGKLVDEYGFDSSRLYNGLGINQWKEAGFDLVDHGTSTQAPCNDATYECKAGCSEGCGGEDGTEPDDDETDESSGFYVLGVKLALAAASLVIAVAVEHL